MYECMYVCIHECMYVEHKKCKSYTIFLLAKSQNVKENLGLVAKASTWACPGWNGALSQACEVGANDIDLLGEGTETLYLVVKFGTCCSGKLDVSMDSLSLLDASGNEQIINGDFGSDEAWVEWRVDQSPSIQFNASIKYLKGDD